MSLMADEPADFTVVEFGSRNAKVGMAGDDKPSHILTYYVKSGGTVVSRLDNRVSAGPLVSPAEEKQRNEAEAAAREGGLKLPVWGGRVNDWDAWSELLAHALRDPINKKNLMLVDGPSIDHRERERVTEFLFEGFGVESLILNSCTSSNLFSQGRFSGLVYSMGHSCTYAAAVKECMTVRHSVVLGGCTGDDLTTLISREFGLGYSNAEHLKSSLPLTTPDAGYETIEHELPDGGKVHITAGMCESVRSTPFMTTPHAPPIDMIQNAIDRSDEDRGFRDEMRNNLILTGKSTFLAGFPRSLHVSLLQCGGFRLNADPNRGENEWIGGSILASLSFVGALIITKADVEEYGPNIANRKC
eukprot:Hpha_TRINITY_DN26897_c0_g1::TRINITY_DN26897_c0_g1_i1::g.17350::m.17350